MRCSRRRRSWSHARLAAHAVGAMLAGTPTGNTLRWRRGFLIGYTARIKQLLETSVSDAVREADRERAAGAPSVAVVLRARRDRVDANMRAAYPPMRAVRHKRAAYADAHRAGARAAESAPVRERPRLPAVPAALGR